MTNVQSEADIAQEFANAQNRIEMSEILKELFEKGKIFMITDLSKDEIRLLTRIYMIAKIKKLKKWEMGIRYYCMLMLSRNRESRKEILKAISGYQQDRTFMSRMNPMNWGGGRR